MLSAQYYLVAELGEEKKKWCSLSSLLDNGAGKLDYKGIKQSKSPDDILNFNSEAWVDY